jgi:hypothetical protein
VLDAGIFFFAFWDPVFQAQKIVISWNIPRDIKIFV